MARHAGAIRTVQWGMVAFYLVLVAVPAFMPLPGDAAHIHDNLVRFAQFVFWGVWWPLVMVSMLLMGRVWCGVFCPEGALTEWASRHGRGAAAPRWLRWEGWPFLAFVSTTVYGQLIAVYEYPKATLLILGGSTVVALAVGFFYGKGRRIWCRHLCPAGGVFSLLSRLAPVHFRVDRELWQRAPRVQPVACPTLINIREMSGNGDCHMCARCGRHRDAVALSFRPFNRETLARSDAETSRWDGALIVLGLMGVATGAFHWSGARLFVAAKQAAAAWLVDHHGTFLLGADAPWFVLTHYPEAGDVFTWLDGIGIVLFIGAVTAVVGAAVFAGLFLAARLVGRPRLMWRLVYALTPMAASGVILGLSALTLTHLKAEGVILPWVPHARAAILALGAAWSGWLAWNILASPAGAPRRVLAWSAMMAGAGVHTFLWARFFFGG